jgi:multidrug resistance efflux pump
MALKLSLPALGRVLTTLVVTAAAAYVAWQLWRHYQIEPWTRDGRVKAYVVQVAPDVTGLVTKVYVYDNQQVTVGTPLFEIDRARFELALREAEATVQAAKVALAQAEREARRNIELNELVAQETREQGMTRVNQARAELAQAVVDRDTARLDLERTRVVSAVDGTVTNLDLRVGSYATSSRAVMAVVDSHSFYVEGYFEETKLPRIHLGDTVRISLMGVRPTLVGHVESFAEGIADRDRSAGPSGLPNVNPTFNWVRLPQRIPVRVALDQVPDSVRLVAGQTATVQVVATAQPVAARATPAGATAPAARATTGAPAGVAADARPGSR